MGIEQITATYVDKERSMSDEMKVERFVPGVEYCREATVYAGVMNARDDGHYVRYTDYADISKRLDTAEAALHAQKWQHAQELKRAESLQQQLAAEREALQAAEADKGKVYEEGWRCAALWACRNDLISDIGSPAYERDKQDALATLQRDRQL